MYKFSNLCCHILRYVKKRELNEENIERIFSLYKKAIDSEYDGDIKLSAIEIRAVL